MKRHNDGAVALGLAFRLDYLHLIVVVDVADEYLQWNRAPHG